MIELLGSTNILGDTAGALGFSASAGEGLPAAMSVAFLVACRPCAAKHCAAQRRYAGACFALPSLQVSRYLRSTHAKRNVDCCLPCAEGNGCRHTLCEGVVTAKQGLESLAIVGRVLDANMLTIVHTVAPRLKELRLRNCFLDDGDTSALCASVEMLQSATHTEFSSFADAWQAGPLLESMSHLHATLQRLVVCDAGTVSKLRSFARADLLKSCLSAQADLRRAYWPSSHFAPCCDGLVFIVSRQYAGSHSDLSPCMQIGDWDDGHIAALTSLAYLQLGGSDCVNISDSFTATALPPLSAFAGAPTFRRRRAL